MGFLDREVRDSFDEMFDWNRDGVLDPMEQSTQMEYLSRLNKVDDEEYDEEEELLDEIEDMDREDAIELLESEGYDPDDFDLDD